MNAPDGRRTMPQTGIAIDNAQATFDARDYRAALGAFGTGVTIVSARGNDGGFVGLTANSFSSVSLAPPLVLWSLSLASSSLPAFRAAKHFVVNVLAEDQIELSRRFALSGGDKFKGVDYRLGHCGAPVIHGVSAHFECRTQAHYDGGDHVIFLGRVEHYSHTEKPTLLFSRGRYLKADRPLAAERTEALSFWEV